MMLKTRRLQDVLAQSLSPSVSAALLFTPAGSMLASGTPPTTPESRKARTLAALAANMWSSYEHASRGNAIDQSLPSLPAQGGPDAASPANSSPLGRPSDLNSLTLELSDYTLHIRAVATRVLLCLVGTKNPSNHTSSNSSLHSHDGEGNGNSLGSPSRSGGSGSAAESANGTPVDAPGRLGQDVLSGGPSLGLLETQARALASFFQDELVDLVLPDDL